MPLTHEQKSAVIEEVAAVASRARVLVAAEYRGMTVQEMTDFRHQARESNVYVRVVKNNLARRALSETPHACASEHLIGPLVLGFSEGEPNDAPRLFRDFSKANEHMELKFGAMDGAVLNTGEVRRLADLPSREEALAQLMAVMRAPAEKLVRTMAAVPAQLARTLGAYRDQRQAQS